MPTSLVRFVFRGQQVAVPCADPTRTVLQWLREDARACGTKEGCAEGDCGACTVIVAELAESAPAETRAIMSQGLALRTANACIRFLPMLEGKALLTVEDLARGAAALHPAQQALVECHGSQCGFCTPGFAMSMALSHERDVCRERHAEGSERPSRAQLADDLAGNLCRCTGYRPILDAAEKMLDNRSASLPLAGVREQLLALASTSAEEAGAGHASSAIQASSARWHAPRSLAALAELRADKPEARLVAGATDVGLWVTKQFRDLGEMIFLGDVAELRQIEARDASLRIGAAVSLEDAWAALVARWPSLAEMAKRFAGPPVRHSGTLVGNLANGSPIGDSAPVLMALGAALVLRRGGAQRRVALERFYTGYMRNELLPGEFVEAVEVSLETQARRAFAPHGNLGWRVQAHKISKRFDCDISALSAGFALRLEAGRVAEIRLAWGGMAATVQRSAGAEAAALGQAWTEPTLRAAQAALAADFTPLSDLRASAAYRQQAAAALLERFWLSTRLESPVPLSQLRAWGAASKGTVASAASVAIADPRP